MSVEEILLSLKNIIHEEGLITNSEFFKNVKNRKRLHSSNPDAFLAVSKSGIPVFPWRNQYGGLSLSVLKRSIAAAKRLHTKTGNDKYKDIVDQLETHVKQLHDKVLHYPINYKLNSDLEAVLKKTRDLGSLSNLGKVE